MKYYGKAKIIKKEKRLCEYIRCDDCGKKINSKYYNVKTGHGDWGNDSVDSIQYKEICCGCIKNYFNNFLITYDYSNTAFIDIETETIRSNKEYYGYYDEYEDRLVEEDENEI